MSSERGLWTAWLGFSHCSMARDTGSTSKCILPPRAAGTRHLPDCSVTSSHYTAHSLYFGSFPWQGLGIVL